MDRYDQQQLFVAVATRRSFAAAARALGRSPQVVTRAVAALEARVGARLLHRTTRSVSLSDEGARYLERIRPLLAELDAIESPERGELRGTLTVAAPILFGQLHVAPIVHAFLRAHPAVDVRLQLHDRVVSLAEEGIDLAVRIGVLPDSSLRARPVGTVRSLLCASPAYLKQHGTPRRPEDLARHQIIAFTGTTPQSVALRPRLTVNTAQAALDAAVAGLGIVRLMSYQVDALLQAKKLRIVLADHATAPIPIHLVQLPGVPSRLTSRFADFAAGMFSAARG